jgi:hypothetical protein
MSGLAIEREAQRREELGDRHKELHEAREAAIHRIDTLARIVADDIDVALRTHAEMWQILQRLDMTSPYAPARERIRESLLPVLAALHPEEQTITDNPESQKNRLTKAEILELTRELRRRYVPGEMTR